MWTTTSMKSRPLTIFCKSVVTRLVSFPVKLLYMPPLGLSLFVFPVAELIFSEPGGVCEGVEVDKLVLGPAFATESIPTQS